METISIYSIDTTFVKSFNWQWLWSIMFEFLSFGWFGFHNAPQDLWTFSMCILAYSISNSASLTTMCSGLRTNFCKAVFQIYLNNNYELVRRYQDTMGPVSAQMGPSSATNTCSAISCKSWVGREFDACLSDKAKNWSHLKSWMFDLNVAHFLVA